MATTSDNSVVKLGQLKTFKDKLASAGGTSSATVGVVTVQIPPQNAAHLRKIQSALTTVPTTPYDQINMGSLVTGTQIGQFYAVHKADAQVNTSLYFGMILSQPFYLTVDSAGKVYAYSLNYELDSNLTTFTTNTPVKYTAANIYQRGNMASFRFVGTVSSSITSGKAQRLCTCNAYPPAVMGVTVASNAGTLFWLEIATNGAITLTPLQSKSISLSESIEGMISYPLA